MLIIELDKMKKYILLGCILIMQFTKLVAQDVTGTVFEENDNKTSSLAGANIIQLNTLNGSISDQDGNFKLSLLNDHPSVIIVSYVSYKNDTVYLKDNFTDINIYLSENNQLEEFQVTGRQRGNYISRQETLGLININEGEFSWQTWLD